MSNTCVLDPSVGNNSFLNYLHQKDLRSRKIFKFSPKPIPKQNNPDDFTFETPQIQNPKRSRHHKSQTLTIASLPSKNANNNNNMKSPQKIINSAEKLPLMNQMNQLLNLKTLSIEKKLGGANSNVMLVRDTRNQQLFVMKIMTDKDPGLLLKYCEKIRFMKRGVSHVQALNVFFQEENFYIILEYMNNAEFLKMLTHRLSEQSCKFYLAELLLGLVHWYSQFKDFHKLLSPENIFLDKQNHLKLSNYGLFTPFNPFSTLIPVSPFCRTGSCKKMTDFEDEDPMITENPFSSYVKNGYIYSDLRSSFLGKDLFMEKLGYFPPEIFQGKESDEKSDSWVIGIWIYEMLTGKHLIKAETAIDFQEYLNEEQEVLVNNRGFSVECEDLIRKLIRKKKEDRLSLEEIKNHEFLKDIDWEKIGKREGNGPVINIGRKTHQRSQMCGGK